MKQSRKLLGWSTFYNSLIFVGHGVMEENEFITLDKKKLDEIKHEIVQNMQRYIDLKLEPVLNYFKKKKDYYEMSFL